MSLAHENHENQNNHKCDLCDKNFNTKGILKVHIKRFHGGNIFQCNLCGKEYKYSNYLAIHVSNKHDNIKKFKCDFCAKSYFHQISLNYHLKVCHSEEQEFHFCEICGKRTKQKSDLRKHVEEVHENVKKYICDLCNSKFYQNQSLKICTHKISS